MKKLLTFIAFFSIVCSGAHAQSDVQKAAAEAAAALMQAPQTKDKEERPQYWNSSAQFDLGTSSTNLWNWAAGGYNTFTLNIGVDAKANYAKKFLSWNNRLQLQYGFFWSADKKNLLQKSNDLMYLESRLAYRTSKESKWNYTASFDFRSQFTDSYDSYKLNEETEEWEGKLKSGLFSPAYTNIALGMDWTPNDWFNVNIAPLTGGFTICTTEELRKKYGMKLRSDDLDPELGENYHNALFQFGAQIKMNFKMALNDIFMYETQLVLFTDYLNSPFKSNRVNWDNKITCQISKYFKVSLDTWLLYDPIVMIDGHQRVQFKDSFAIKFTYLISNKR